MKTFTIGKTRSRASIAIVCAGTLAGAVALAAGCGEGDALAYLAALNPTARAVFGGAIGLLLGLLALSSMVTSSQYWRLTETEIRCRSLRVSADWPRYVWDVLCGREPEVDICINTANVTRVCLSWERKVITMPWTHGIPFPVYPLTVRFALSDGGSVDFYDLERDVETLARALRYLVEERGVAFDDPDGLLAHMTGGALAAESLYAYLDSLDRAKQKDREGR